MLYDVSDDIRAVQVMCRLARIMNDRSPQAYFKAAGQHLIRLRRRTDGETWSELVRGYCGISRRRAYELMEIAAGSKSLKQQRSEKAASVRRARLRAKKS